MSLSVAILLAMLLFAVVPLLLGQLISWGMHGNRE